MRKRRISYLGNAKKTRLPYGFRQMVAQVFIILRSDDGREPLQGMFRVFTE